MFTYSIDGEMTWQLYDAEASAGTAAVEAAIARPGATVIAMIELTPSSSVVYTIERETDNGRKIITLREI